MGNGLKNAKMHFQIGLLILTAVVSLQQGADQVAGEAEPETDLGQLPGHHPLIKEGMSDEGLSEQLVWCIVRSRVQTVK